MPSQSAVLGGASLAMYHAGEGSPGDLSVIDYFFVTRC